MDAEQKERSAASIAWMKEAFAVAKADGSLGLVLMTQANVRFESMWTPKLMKRFFENFTRVETFGGPNSHWVRVIVDPKDPQLFSYRQEIVRENVVNRRKK